MPRRRLHSALLALIAAFGSSALASAETPRRVGVVVTLGVNMSADEQRAIATELGAALAETLPVDVIAGVDAERRLPADGLPDECVAQPECRSDIGSRLDADELLLLVAVRLGDRTQIDATWTNVHSGEVTSRPRLTLAADADRAAYFREMAPRLLPHIQRPATPAPTEVVVVTRSEDGERSGHHMTTGAWIGAGVAAVGVLGGTVFTVSSKRKYDTLADAGCRDAATPACRESDVDSLGRHALAADLFYGVALAAGVTSIVLYLRSEPDEGASVISVSPMEGGAQLGFGGRF